MKYRNTKTGQELESSCPISGGSWEAVQEREVKAAPKTPARPARKKTPVKK